MIILFGVVALEGCFLVRYFTRFTEEIFACLISAIFIYEAIHFLEEVCLFIVTEHYFQKSDVLVRVQVKRKQ